MTQQFSMKLPDDVADRLRSAAGSNVSQWIAEAIQDRLDRDMWRRSREVDHLLGITDDWMREQVALREHVRGELQQ